MDGWTLAEVIEGLRVGRFTIPNFQRDFVWDARLIRELLWSILRDYHIGSLLLWEGTEDTVTSLKCREIARDTPNKPDPRSQWIVLDGQQRLTAMHYAFFAPDKPLPRDRDAEPMRFFVNVREFMAETNGGPRRAAIEVAPASTIDAEPRRSTAFKLHRFPLQLLSQDPREQSRWGEAYEKYWSQQVRRLKKQAVDYPADGDEGPLWDIIQRQEEAQGYVNQIGDFLRQIEILKLRRIMSVPLDKDEDVVRVKDTFLQVNRHGIQLSDFELLNAVVAINGLSPCDLARRSHEQLQNNGLNLHPSSTESLVSKIMLLRIHPDHDSDASVEPYLVPGERVPTAEGSRVLIENPEEFRSRWEEATAELSEGLESLRDWCRCLPDDKQHTYAPLDALIPNYCALRTDAAGDPMKERKLLQWYWANLLSGNYENIPDGAPQKGKDYGDMREWFERDTRSAKDAPDVVRDITDRFNPRRSQRSHELVRTGTTAENNLPAQASAVLSLLRRRNPYDWRTGARVRDAGKGITEGFIVPLRWCDEMGIAFSDSRSVFNSFVGTGEMLADIDGEMPHNYLRAIEKRWSDQGWALDKLDAAFESHFLTPEVRRLLGSRQFTVRAFEEFLVNRQVALFRWFGQDLYNVDLGLDPNDRELDTWLADIEIRLKEILAKDTAAHATGRYFGRSEVMQMLDERGVLRDASRYEGNEREQFLKNQLGRLSFLDVGMAVAEEFNRIRRAERWPDDYARGRFVADLHAARDARNELRHPPTNWTRDERQRCIVAARVLRKLLTGGER